MKTKKEMVVMEVKTVIAKMTTRMGHPERKPRGEVGMRRRTTKTTMKMKREAKRRQRMPL